MAAVRPPHAGSLQPRKHGTRQATGVSSQTTCSGAQSRGVNIVAGAGMELGGPAGAAQRRTPAPGRRSRDVPRFTPKRRGVPNIGGAAREEPVELMSTPNRIRTGDRLRESCETRRATNLLICRSFRAPGPPSETSLLFRIFRISSGCSGCNWGSAAKTRGLSPYPRGPRSPSLENGDTPRASEMLRRRPDGQADHRKARRVGRPARMLRAAGGSGYGGLLLRSWRGAGPVDRRRLRRHRGLWTGRSRGVHASHVLTQLQHVA